MHLWVVEYRPVIIRFAKEQLNISEVVGRYTKENYSSGNVMRKLGFTYEADIPYECNEGKIVREGIQCRLKFNCKFGELKFNTPTNFSLISS